MEDSGGEERRGEERRGLFLPFFLRFAHIFSSSFLAAESVRVSRSSAFDRVTQTFQSHDTRRADKISTCGEIRKHRDGDELKRLFAESLQPYAREGGTFISHFCR